MDKGIYKKIKKLRVKLEEAVDKKGLNSSEVRKLSDEMDNLINEYEESIKIVKFRESNKMLECYKESYLELKALTEREKIFPTVQQWDKYAKENDLISHTSLEYISKLNWNKLRTRVYRELNMKMKR